MEIFGAMLIPGLFTLILARTLLLPIRLTAKLGLHALCGIACLVLLSSAAAYTGVLIPINFITVIIAWFLGAPGIGLLALLATIG